MKPRCSDTAWKASEFLPSRGLQREYRLNCHVSRQLVLGGLADILRQSGDVFSLSRKFMLGVIHSFTHLSYSTPELKVLCRLISSIAQAAALMLIF